MKYQLAQLNIARFMQPQDDEINRQFFANLDRVNAIAESHPGFVWRLIEEHDEGSNTNVFDDDKMIVNLSVWQDVESLRSFVYQNSAHREVMRRRREWFDQIDVYLVLWWIAQGHIPTAAEAKAKLQLLERQGPTSAAFTFKQHFPHG